MRSVSDLDLERFLVDDLEPAHREHVAAAIAADPELQAAIAHRRLEQHEWQASASVWLPPTSIADRVRAWLGALQRSLSVSMSNLAVVGAVAGIALVVVVARGTNAGDGAAEAVRARGVADVVVAVQRDGHVFRFAQQPLRAGDAVRLGGAPPHSRATVVTVDVHGVTSLVLHDAVVDGDGWLAGSLILDDSEGPERFVIATSSAAVSVNATRLVQLVHDAATSTVGLSQLRAGPALAAANVQQVQQVRFEKEARP